jgi:hypothetical protein
MDFDQWTAIASTPARQPPERTLDLIDNNADAAKISDDLSLRKYEALSTKSTDDRL